MIIQTKYNYGDKVWVMYNNKPTQIEIETISIDVIIHGIINNITYYSTTLSETLLRFDEKELFSTKDELLDSLR